MENVFCNNSISFVLMFRKKNNNYLQYYSISKSNYRKQKSLFKKHLLMAYKTSVPLNSKVFHRKNEMNLIIEDL